MKVALAQINTTVGDVEGNTGRAVQAVREGARLGAQMVILPELTLSGYPPQDLAERPAFIDANEKAVRRVADAARGVYAIVGHIAGARRRTGKPAANAASVLRDGQVMARRDKSLLPTYDVFDEARYFQPALTSEPVALGHLRVGLTICEDAWNDPTFWGDRLYERDPVQELAEAGADLLVNISASPFSAGKQQFRRAMLGAAAQRHGLPLLYVNLVGGNDQLLFDGRSLALDARGETLACGRAFEEDLIVVESDHAGTDSLPAEPLLEPVEEIWRALLLGTRDYVRKCGFSTVVLALSGGVDSALTATLAARALGPENVTALFMPTCFSSDRSRRDAEALSDNLGIRLVSISIEELRTTAERALEPHFRGAERGVAEENIQARLRGCLVMAFANKFGSLPLATGNKSELAVGYCTLYGDMVGGLAVIGDVPKTTVYELAFYSNRDGETIPESILTRPPSAELKPDQTDQDVLPPYEVLDPILDLYVEEGLEFDAIVDAGHDAETVRRVLAMVDGAEFKRRQAPITLRVTHKAFGPGRRLPVAQNWRR
ncbi:MAG: NAD+ synthase [Candidatus Brocadiaceae bacterium]